MLSHIWCAECVQDKISRLFPKDMGFETEEKGNKLRFLTTWLTTKDGDLHIQPYQPNMRCVVNISSNWLTSRCPHFLCKFSTPSSKLKLFLIAHLHTYARICVSNHRCMYRHICILIAEAHMCGWSFRDILCILKLRCLRHKSEELDICISLAIALEKLEPWKMFGYVHCNMRK